MTEQNRLNLIRAFYAVDVDDSVRAVVLSGTRRAYCAGADLSGSGSTFVTESAADGEVPPSTGGVVSLRIYRMTKPIVAALTAAARSVFAVPATLSTVTRHSDDLQTM